MNSLLRFCMLGSLVALLKNDIVFVALAGFNFKEIHASHNWALLRDKSGDG